MSRKIMMAAVPVTAFVITLFVADICSSQAFAKGWSGRGGHGYSQHYRGNYRFSHRYGWGYPGYGFYGYEAPVYQPVAPVCATCEPVAAPPVAPVCTACEPVVAPPAPPVCTTCEPVVAPPAPPVCTTCEPAVAPPVAPVCTTCAPTYVAVESRYSPYWGYRHFRHDGRFYGRGGHYTGGRRR